MSDLFVLFLQRPREPQGCVGTVAEAEQMCRSLPHRGEMPQCWRRPSKIAEDAALSSWPGICQQPRGQLSVSSLAKAKLGGCAGVSNRSLLQRPREPQGCVDTAAETKQRC